YNVLGLLVHMKGEAESAIFAFRRAVEVSTEQADERNLAYYLLNLGLTLHQHGDSTEAESVLRRSISLQEKYPTTDTLNFVSASMGLAEVLVNKKDAEGAEPYYHRASESLNDGLVRRIFTWSPPSRLWQTLAPGCRSSPKPRGFRGAP